MTSSKALWWPLKPPGGGDSKRPKIQVPEEPGPSPMPIRGREEEEAKKKVRLKARRRGRESTILAGRMTAQLNNILKTRLG